MIMTLRELFKRQSILQPKSYKFIPTLVVILFAMGNIGAQQLVTNGDFEAGLAGWTITSTGTGNNYVLNTGAFNSSCTDAFTVWMSPQPQIADLNSVASDLDAGTSKLVSGVIAIPEACSKLKLSVDVEYESLAPLDPMTQDIKITAFDAMMNNLGTMFSLTGSGSGQAHVPHATICRSIFNPGTGSGSAGLAPLSGQNITLEFEATAQDGCFPHQFDNIGLVCHDPLVAMDIEITDPCSCTNPNNVVQADGSYFFHDILHVSSGVGLTTVHLAANDGFLVDATNTPIPVGTVFTEVTPGEYELEFFTLSGTSSNIEVSTGFGSVAFTAGGCVFEGCNDSCPTTLACNNNIQISLGHTCEAIFDPNLILEGTITDCPFSVRIKDANDVVLLASEMNGGAMTHPVIDATFIGDSYKAEVFYLDDNGVEVTCWGWFTVEDKLGPTLTCAPDVTVSCKDNVTVDAAELAAIGLVDNCGNAEIRITRDVLNEHECGPDGITAERLVEYIAIDNNGLVSQTCSYLISYSKIDLADLDFPSNYEGECVDGETPDADITGVPNVGGCDLMLTDNLCKFNISFTDDTTRTCGSNISILRKWVVLDWCAAEHRQSYQTIKISDTEPPVVSCPIDITVEATAGCSGTYTFDPFEANDLFDAAIIDDCSSLTFQAQFLTADERDVDDVDQPFNNMSGNGPFTATLPGGQSWIKYIATDACGNSSECRMEVFVQDNQAPIAICDQFTAVSLADNGWGRVYGPSLDDGSYDQCGGEVTFEVRRSDTPCGDDASSDRDDTIFGDYVQFCCSEAGDTVRVELKVLDPVGSFSTCSVNVVVQDKHNNFDMGCPMPAVITADCDMNLSQIKNMYGSPNPSNSCGAVPTFISEDDDSGLGDCGAGSISRIWTAVYGQDTTNTTCMQTIQIEKASTLSRSSFNPPTSNPVANCSNYFEDTGDGPSLRSDNVCADVGFTFEDNSFFNVEGYCVKVIRTWTAIDFCNYNAGTGEGIWEWTQTIKVSDTTGPEIDEDSCPEDIVVVTDSGDCEVAVNMPMPSAVDACTGEVIPDSGFTWAIEGTTHAGIGNTASATLGVGEYEFVWTVTGICGANASNTCEATIKVEDTTGPTPYCRSVVTTVISNSNVTGNPSVDIWAGDFNLGTRDDCDSTSISISFSSTDLNDTRRVYECHQLGFHTLEIYFTDQSGNQEFCVASVNIQANGDVCDTIGQRSYVRVEGDVYTEDNKMVEDVEVGLQAMVSSSMNFEATNENGHFAFDNIEAYSDYRLEAQGESDYLNGVSTLDLIMIQRHILGLEDLDSPYKLIAADINNSADINGLDLIELRKLILGIYVELPQNDSWRFVDESYQFTDVTAPWPFSEKIELQQLAQDMMDNDFIAVKIGDVNTTAIVNGAQDIETGLNSGAQLETEVHTLAAGNEYLIPVYLNQAKEVYGVQFKLNFDEDLEIKALESGKLKLDAENYALEGNQAMISYNEEELFSIEPGEALFYLTVSGSNSLNNNGLDAGSLSLEAELYKEGYAVENVSLGALKPSFVTILHQNIPNPFTAETLIEFELPQAGEATLTILDLNGKTVKSINGYYNAGKNSLTIDQNDLSEDGVYYYQLDTENFSATKKMVRLK